MNAVDATDRESQTDAGISPSLLTIILDTNPNAWALLSSDLPLSKVVANLMVFINAHIAVNHMNRVAVIASHSQKAEWLYPTSHVPKEHGKNGQVNGDEDVDMNKPESNDRRDDANKYRPFAHIEHDLTTNLRRLISTTATSDLSSTPSTMVAGALTMALSYISKLCLSAPTLASSSADQSNTAGSFTNATADGTQSASTAGLTARVLIVSVSGDLAAQYIPIMNSIFACQRLHIPIDILKLAGDTVFLQQAADATGGIYMAPSSAQQKAGLLQYLMMAYLPDQSARKWLILPGEGGGVDFRAACFCHRRVVDIGFVCSICLSIFCEPLVDSTCLTCGTHLGLANYGTKPVVVAQKKDKKKKKKRALDDGGRDTPASGNDTPG